MYAPGDALVKCGDKIKNQCTANHKRLYLRTSKRIFPKQRKHVCSIRISSLMTDQAGPSHGFAQPTAIASASRRFRLALFRSESSAVGCPSLDSITIESNQRETIDLAHRFLWSQALHKENAGTCHTLNLWQVHGVGGTSNRGIH